MTYLPGDLPNALTSATPYILAYGYWAVLVLVLTESIGVPVPGELTLITAAIFAGVGQLNIVVVIFIAVAGSVLGDSLGFLLGSYGGQSLVERYGKYILINHDRIESLKSFYSKNGAKVIIVARFIAVLRQLNGIVAGISDMTWLKFLRYNAIGAVLWVVFWSMIGYYGGSHIATIIKYDVYISIIVLVSLGAIIIRKVLLKKI